MTKTLASPQPIAFGLPWLFGAVIAVAVAILSTAAHAAPLACVDHKELSNFLAEKHSEAPVGVGLANNGGLVQVYSSPQGKTWTIFMTMPDGTACLMAAGEDWEKFDPKLFGPRT